MIAVSPAQSSRHRRQRALYLPHRRHHPSHQSWGSHLPHRPRRLTAKTVKAHWRQPAQEVQKEQVQEEEVQTLIPCGPTSGEEAELWACENVQRVTQNTNRAQESLKTERNRQHFIHATPCRTQTISASAQRGKATQTLEYVKTSKRESVRIGHDLARNGKPAQPFASGCQQA